MADEYATRRAEMDSQAIGEALPPVRSAVRDELDAAATGLQVALDLCRNVTATQRVRRAAGRMRIAATLSPELQPQIQPLIDRLDDAIDCIGWIGCGTIKTVQDELLEILEEARR